MSEVQIGWKLDQVCASIKQGSSGAIELVATVENDDGSPLPSYDGWAAELKLFRKPNIEPDLTITPAVVGNTEAKQLVITIEFAAEDTADVAPGTLSGDVRMLAPNGKPFFPANFELNVQRSFSK